MADVDELSGRPLTDKVSLRESAGRGSTPTDFSVQPGERIFITGFEVRGNERFFKVRSFDGLKRGWIPESSVAPQDRPPR